MESDVEIAKKEVDRLEHVLKSLPDEAFDKECRPEFILSAEVSGPFSRLRVALLDPAKSYCVLMHVACTQGDAYTFKSTFGRELGFCVHHAIHHHHSIKVYEAYHKPA